MGVNLSEGDKVLVALPPAIKENTLRNSPLRQFDGMSTTIRAVKHVKSYAYYELNGMVSKYGVPYAFTRDWLIPER